MTTELNKKLLDAAKKGQPRKIQEFIDLGADVNCMSDDGDRPLELAIEAKDIASIKALLKHNAAIDYPKEQADHRRSTGLTLACEEGFISAVKLFVDNGAAINVPDGEKPPLMVAMLRTRSHNPAFKNNATTIVNYLIDNGANLNCRYICAGTPLLIATEIDDNDYELLRTLLEKGADLNQPLYADSDMTLLSALDNERYDIDGAAKYIIAQHMAKHGILADNKIPSGMYRSIDDQLVIAAALGNPVLIDALIEQGANVNAKSSKAIKELKINYDDTAMMIAAKLSDISLIDKFHSLGADVSEAFKFAISERKFPVIEFLLDKIDSNKLNEGLIYTCINYYSDKNEIIKLLLSHGADVNFKGVSGDTTFEVAVKRNIPKVVSLLLESGQPVSNQDIQGIVERNNQYLCDDIKNLLKSHMESNQLSAELSEQNANTLSN